MALVRLFAFILAVSCMAAPAWAATEILEIDSRQAGKTYSFEVEIVRTPEEKARGLMFRTQMPADSGMLFLNKRPEPMNFWMKNTFIPLDMLFIDEKGIIRRIHSNATPHDLTPIPSGSPVLGVLEINGGLAGQLGIRAGDSVRHAAFGSGVK